MRDKKVILQYSILTFCIAYGVSGLLIILGQFGYRVYGVVNSLQQIIMNIPFAIYILSPAIASYIVLKRNSKVADLQKWLQIVFWIKNKFYIYLLISAGLIFYFGLHIMASGHMQMIFPFYMFFLSLPGNLIIGGLEEAGWTYVLQPGLDKRYGFVVSSVLVGIIWIFWHIPLFFIPGTNHAEGLLNFWMFNIQVMALSFFRGAIYKVAGKGAVFAYVLFHTMFNSASSLFGSEIMTWKGTIAANMVMILYSIIIVNVYNKFKPNNLSDK